MGSPCVGRARGPQNPACGDGARASTPREHTGQAWGDRKRAHPWVTGRLLLTRFMFVNNAASSPREELAQAQLTHGPAGTDCHSEIAATVPDVRGPRHPQSLWGRFLGNPSLPDPGGPWEWGWGLHLATPDSP